MEEMSTAMHGKHLIPSFMPALPYDLEKRLKEGGLKTLDVGCGNGFHAEKLGKSFFGVEKSSYSCCLPQLPLRGHRHFRARHRRCQ